MTIAVDQARKLEARVPKPPRVQGDSTDEESSDCAEDNSDDDKVVDTDAETSDGSLASSSSCSSLAVELAKSAATGAGAATGAEKPAKPAATGPGTLDAVARAMRGHVEPLWGDPYFYIWDNPISDAVGKNFLMISMRKAWRQPLPTGMVLPG